MAQEKHRIIVKPSQLPASCPPAGQKSWNKHPRVFIKLSPACPEQACPYCGAMFVLEKAAGGKPL